MAGWRENNNSPLFKAPGLTGPFSCSWRPRFFSSQIFCPKVSKSIQENFCNLGLITADHYEYLQGQKIIGGKNLANENSFPVGEGISNLLSISSRLPTLSKNEILFDDDDANEINDSTIFLVQIFISGRTQKKHCKAIKQKKIIFSWSKPSSFFHLSHVITTTPAAAGAENVRAQKPICANKPSEKGVGKIAFESLILRRKLHKSKSRLKNCSDYLGSFDCQEMCALCTSKLSFYAFNGRTSNSNNK